jgi:hypothetical protein
MTDKRSPSPSGNLIDRLADYFDLKGDAFGEWYTRCLIGFLIMWCAAGFATGFMIQLLMRQL